MGHHKPYVCRTWTCGFAGLGLLISLGANAGGFALIEQSVSSMGTAYANGSAGIDDASTIYFNPASMTRLDGKQLSGGVHVVRSDADFSGKSYYNPDNPAIQQSGLAGQPIDGKKNDDLGLTAGIPHAAYSHQYNDQLWLGLTMNAPYGLRTEYSDNDWVGRYNALKSDVTTVNINPSIAWKIDEHASVGFGVSTLYAKGELTNAVDGGLLAALNGTPIPGWQPGTSTYDGKAKLTGDDWGYGYNLGILLTPTESTRLGIAYRSKVDLTIDGDAKVSGLGAFDSKRNAKLDLSLPDTISLSGLHQLNPRWAVMADITWTKWSSLNQLDVKIQGGSQSVTPLEWNDTTRFSLGVTYKYSESWLFRTGAAFDQTPVPDTQTRTARVPDADRTWLAIGANYKYNKQLSFDFGYAHLFVDNPDIKSSDAYDPGTGLHTGFHTLDGSYDASVDILSAQINWKFN